MYYKNEKALGRDEIFETKKWFQDNMHIILKALEVQSSIPGGDCTSFSKSNLRTIRHRQFDTHTMNHSIKGLRDCRRTTGEHLEGVTVCDAAKKKTHSMSEGY